MVSGNFRAWYEYLSQKDLLKSPNEIAWGLIDIAQYLHFAWPEIFPPAGDPKITTNQTEPIIFAEMTNEERLVHCTATVRFITNRGVTHELVRHRLCAFSQESTRYVRYDGGMEFIQPVWLNAIWKGDWPDYNEGMRKRFNRRDEDWMNVPAEFIYTCCSAETHYRYLINNGWQPQQAREVLPNALKTEIVVTTTLSHWQHIFNLRCSKAAHPQMRALMLPLQEEFKYEMPELF